MSATPSIDTKKIKKALESKRQELSDVAKHAAESTKPVELDQTSVGRLSRMDAMQVQAMAQATEQRRAAEISRIDAALDRIESGDFGYCLSCGEEIAPKRLAHDPATPVCVD